MATSPANSLRDQIDHIYRNESRRVYASLVRLLGDFELAEEAMHDAFALALAQWSNGGIPQNPSAWLISAGRFKAIDSIRRRVKFDASLELIAERIKSKGDGTGGSAQLVEDDRLRLIFTCCHPAIAPHAQIALTLREVCGLTTEEIASAFLTSATTIAQRIVRAKSKIRDARIPYEIPSKSDLASRLEQVLKVIYLVFNEGYAASSGASVTRAELTGEAIRLGRLLLELLPESEVQGLLALMLLQDSRRPARATENGDIILLENQDRSLWDRSKIEEGTQLVESAFASQPVGPYALQAAIAAVHANASEPAATDWPQIVSLYDVLLSQSPSPIVRLNRAVAVAMRDGPEAGLSLINEILDSGSMSDYHLAHAAKGDMCRRLGRQVDALEAYQKSLSLAQQEPERRFLENRIHELKK